MQQAPSILLVEDDENDLILIQRSIQKSRLVNPVRVVYDGEAAINYLRGEGEYAERSIHPVPFLVLLDLHLPKVNGFEVLGWIRSQPQYRNLKVVVLTASSEERVFRTALQLGGDSYFVKPGSLEEFVRLMERIKGRLLLLDGQFDEAQSDLSSVVQEG